jgi:hypothetical protein
VLRVIRHLGHGADPREDEEQAAEGAGGAYAELAAARRFGDAGEARLLPLLVAARAVPALLVVIADRDEQREVRAEGVRDHRVPRRGVVRVIQISEMEHEVGALGFDQLQNRARFAGQALVADEGDGQRRGRSGAVSRAVGGGRTRDQDCGNERNRGVARIVPHDRLSRSPRGCLG